MPRWARLWLVAVLPMLVAATETTNAPPILRCRLIARQGCVDNVCIGDAIKSDFVIRFDFKRKRYGSAWGRGRITQMWDQNGSHWALLSSPPALATMSFSADWRTAKIDDGNGATKSYGCD
jgi:hypothetical protein